MTHRDRPIIRPHAGYEKLRSYVLAQIVYDDTVFFCRKYLDPRSRTVDQMTQAARSGKQNIVEGSRASGTSKKTEFKLYGVARASLEELLEDYRDYLRQNGLSLRQKEHPKSLFIRKLHKRISESNLTDPSDQTEMSDSHESYSLYKPLHRTKVRRNLRQYACLPHTPGQLSDGPAHPQRGKGIRRGRRHHRAPLHCPEGSSQLTI